MSDRAASELWVRFDPTLIPGYAWSFPLVEGKANIGIALPRQAGTSGQALNATWRAILNSPFFTSLLGEHATREGAVRAWPIPTGVRDDDCVGWEGKILFLGDAAGTADPFTGEGIAQALESGSLAGQSVISGGAESAAPQYVATLRRALFTEQRMARVARTVFSSGFGARAAIRATGSGTRIGSTVGRWLYEEYPRTVLTRPGTWRSMREVRPGAFVEHP